MLTRRRLLETASAVSWARNSRTASTNKNAVFILADDLGAWALNSYGCKSMRTPNLDRLAADGVKFTRAFACTPVCSPSRMTYFTGRLPSHHGVQDWLNGEDSGKSQKISFKTAMGDQDFTVYGDSYSNARAGIPFINTSTTASNNGGPGGMPGTFTPSSSAENPASSTYSTYSGSPAYPLDTKTGYPLNSGPGLRRLAVGFRTGDHTGSSVPVTAEGPGAFLFTGYMDESDIFFKMAAALSADTTEGDKLIDSLVNSTTLPKTIGK